MIAAGPKETKAATVDGLTAPSLISNPMVLLLKVHILMSQETRLARLKEELSKLEVTLAIAAATVSQVKSTAHLFQ